MIVAVAVTTLGVFCVALITQLFGYRTGGTIVIPVLAVYTLKNVLMLPIFLFSTVIAYLGLSIAKQRTLIYGRDELLLAMALGSGIPLIILIVLGAFISEALRTVVFIGSILPGLAAYNYHQVKPEFRTRDLLTTSLLFIGLILLGWVLITPGLSRSIGTLAPPVLYTTTADVAVFKSASVSVELRPGILSRPVAVTLFLIGILLSERIRGRYGVRTGLMAMALLAIYALVNAWLIGLYLLVIVVAYAGLKTVHYGTLLYGRVLIAVSVVTALLVVIPLVLALPIQRGLSAYFVAILAGVNAYSWHVTAPRKRVLFFPLQIGAFLILLMVTQVGQLIEPTVAPALFGLPGFLACAVVVVVCAAFVEWRTVDLPDQERIFEASILSGGGDA